MGTNLQRKLFWLCADRVTFGEEHQLHYNQEQQALKDNVVDCCIVHLLSTVRHDQALAHTDTFIRNGASQL